MGEDIDGLGAPMSAYVDAAYEYYMQDRLDVAMKVVRDAFESAGWPPGGWTEFYNELQCEKDARDASSIERVDGNLAIEVRPEEPESVREALARAAVDARQKVGELLDLDLGSAPALVTVFLPDAPLGFISGAFGYAVPKRGLHKICIPHDSLVSYDSSLETLMHEFSHVAAYELAGEDLPRWLDEGLAMYLAEDMDSRQARFILRTASRQGLLLSLDRLEDALTSSDLRIDDPIAVDQAYLLVGHLLHWWAGQFGMPSVRAVLERIGRGESVGRAVRAETRHSLARLESNWRQSLREGS